MAPVRFRSTIGQIMAAVALSALALAVLPTGFLVVAFLLGVPYATILVVAKRGLQVSAVKATAWVCAGYPSLTLLGLYSTWVVAGLTLGRRPRPMVDDPNRIGLLVDILYAPTIWLLVGAYFTLPVGLALLFHEAADHFAVEPAGRPPARRGDFPALIAFAAASWLSALLVLACDPGKVLDWFMD